MAGMASIKLPWRWLRRRLLIRNESISGARMIVMNAEWTWVYSAFCVVASVSAEYNLGPMKHENFGSFRFSKNRMAKALVQLPLERFPETPPQSSRFHFISGLTQIFLATR